MMNKKNNRATLLSEIKGTMDLFICSASFEKRSLSIALELSPDNVRKTIIFQNEGILGNGEKHGQKIFEHFLGKAETILISKDKAITTGDRIIDALSKYGAITKLRCYIDITCMTHEALLILFIVVRHVLDATAEINFLYTPATEYDPGTKDEDKWLSKGIVNVRSILGFPGELKPSQNNHLIILVGFEVERTLKLVEVLEPHSMSLGIGLKKPMNEKHKKINEQKHKRLQVLFPQADSFEFSPSEAFEVKNQILEQAKKFKGMNILIAPMNTKVSTLGVALAALECPEIQICYAPASFYNIDNYSNPSDDCRHFRLN